MRVAFAWAHPIAWAMLNISVILQWIPSFSSSVAATMPSQVDASFIKILSLGIPASWYRARYLLAFWMLPWTSKESLASTSVETLPGTIFKISIPKFTNAFSTARSMDSLWDFPFFFPCWMASSIRNWYSGFSDAAKIKEGFVVASVGLYFLISSSHLYRLRW